MAETTRGGRTRRGREPLGGPRGDVRVGPLGPIPAVLAEHGLDPVQVLGKVGLHPCVFDDQDNRVSFLALGRLFETCVNLTQCQHFGLMIGERFTLDALGVLGQVMRNSPTVRDALRLAIQHIELHDRGAVALALDLGKSRAALGYALFDGGTPAADQILVGAMAIHCRIFRELCGRSWKPLTIQLSHRRPKSLGAFRRLFGPTLEFDARISAVVFDARWLDHPIAGADPATYSAIVDTIASMEARQHAPFADQVRRAIHAMLFSASASSATIANLFNLHERTLRRRLHAEGATVRELVSEVRHEIADHLLRDTTLPVSEIAAVLRYSDATVFARAFRSRSRMSPSEWRVRHAAAREP
jgi:AraC-like DNA-binding protein